MRCVSCAYACAVVRVRWCVCVSLVVSCHTDASECSGTQTCAKWNKLKSSGVQVNYDASTSPALSLTAIPQNIRCVPFIIRRRRPIRVRKVASLVMGVGDFTNVDPGAQNSVDLSAPGRLETLPRDKIPGMPTTEIDSFSLW